MVVARRPSVEKAQRKGGRQESYRFALEQAKLVSPNHVPCSWCGKPTPGPDMGVILCPACTSKRK
jgi:hypothetical protein